MNLRSLFLFSGISIAACNAFQPSEIQDKVQILLARADQGKFQASARLIRIGRPAVPYIIQILKETKAGGQEVSSLFHVISEILRKKENRDDLFLSGLNELVYMDSPFKSYQAIQIISEYRGDPLAGEVLKGIIERHPDEERRAGAIKGLVWITEIPGDLAPLLRGLLSDKSPLVRATAAGFLGQMKDDSGYETALVVLRISPQIKNTRIRRITRTSSIESLGMIGNKDAIPVLRGIIQTYESSDQKDNRSSVDSNISEAYSAIRLIEFEQLPTRHEQLDFLRKRLNMQGDYYWAANKLFSMNDRSAMRVLKAAASEENGPGNELCRSLLLSRFPDFINGTFVLLASAGIIGSLLGKMIYGVLIWFALFPFSIGEVMILLVGLTCLMGIIVFTFRVKRQQ